MGVDGQHVVVLVFALQVLLIEVVESNRRGFARCHHERQLKGFRLGEAPWRITNQRPDEVNHTILRLVHQIGRFAAQLHGRIEFHLDLAAGFGLNLFSPWCQHLCRNGCLRRQHLVQFQHHIGGCCRKRGK